MSRKLWIIPSSILNYHEVSSTFIVRKVMESISLNKNEDDSLNIVMDDSEFYEKRMDGIEQ